MYFLAAIITATALHEAGHFACARWLGVRVKRAGIDWRRGGVYLVREQGSDTQNLAISLAGPMANLLLSGSLLLVHWLGPFVVYFALVNFLLGVVNLVPFPRSDGHRVVSILRNQRTCITQLERAA